ncbi:MAG: hypothetical protein ACRD3P_00740 [Terriglobales bacterium]
MAKRGSDDQYLADKLRRYETENRREKYERFLVYIANLNFPVGEADDVLLRQLRTATEEAWPEIWSGNPELPPPDFALRTIQKYLRQCWNAHSKRDRLWHIHRAIEYCQTFRVFKDAELTALHKAGARAIREGDAQQLHALNLRVEHRTTYLLDQPPPPSPDFSLEGALFHLQEMADIPARKPRHCDPPGVTCERPYFFSDKKGRKYCPVHRIGTIEARSRENKGKKKTWHDRKHIYRMKKEGTK